MSNISDINFDSALNSLPPEMMAELAQRVRNGEAFTREQIMNLVPEEPGMFEGAMNTVLDSVGGFLERVSTNRPKMQAIQESNPDFYRGKVVADQGPNEITGRGLVAEAPSALTGLGINIGSVFGGGKAVPKLLNMLKKSKSPRSKLLGYALGGLAGEFGMTGYGVATKQLPPEAIDLSTGVDALGKYANQLLGTRDSQIRRDLPGTFQELPGLTQDYGTAMDWSIDEPVMGAAIGLLGKLGLKGGKTALKKAVDYTAPARARATSPADEALGTIPSMGDVEEALAIDPKYREMVGKKVVSWFSGTGTLEAGLPGAKPVRAVEYDPMKMNAYNDAHGTNFSASSVLDEQAIKDLKDADPDLFHASPECKAFSTVATAASQESRGCKDLDLLNSIIRAIKVAKPKNISLENAPGYQTAGDYRMVPRIDKKTGQQAVQTITKKDGTVVLKNLEKREIIKGTEGKYYNKLITALEDIKDKNGNPLYSIRTDKANVAKYGGAASRDRLYIRASRVHDLNTPDFDLPAMSSPKDWWTEIEDLLPGAKVETDNWRTLKGDDGEPLVGIGAVKRAVKAGRVTDKSPIWYNGDGSNARLPAVKNRFSHKKTSEYEIGDVTPIPAIVSAPQKVRILMPKAEFLPEEFKHLENRSLLVTSRMLARLQGLPDSFKLPNNFYDAKEVIGNGMHTTMTDALIRPMLAKTPLDLLSRKGGIPQLAGELGETLKVDNLDFMEGANKFTAIDEGILGTTGAGAGNPKKWGGRIFSAGGSLHRQLDNMLNIIQKIEGVGGDEFLRTNLFDVGVDGILVEGKRIGGQLSYEAHTAETLRTFSELAAKIDAFRYMELKKSPTIKGAKDIVFRKSARSEAISNKIVDAIQSVDLEDFGKVSDDGGVKLRQDLAEALKVAPLRNAKGEIFKHKGKEVMFGGEDAVNLAAFMAEEFREQIVNINKIRVSMGHNTINMLPRYFPHMHKLNVLEDYFDGLVNLPDDLVDKFNKSLSSGVSHSDYSWFGSLMHRATKKEDYSRNIIEVFENYTRGANKIIHNTIPAKVVRDRVEYLAKANKLTGKQAIIFNKWIDEGLLGKSNSFDQWIQKAPTPILNTALHVKALGDRFSRNILVGSASFMINNLTSLAQVVATAGVRRTAEAVVTAAPDLLLATFGKTKVGAEQVLKGMAFTGNRMGMDFAMTHSKVMQQRLYTGYEEIGREALGRGKIYGGLSHLIDTADQWNVAVSFNANYMTAIKRGIPHEQAVKFADDMAYKTQAIYSAAYKPELLRSRYLGAVAPFQTWVNNLNSFVRNEIIGGRMGGPGAEGLRRAGGEVDKEFFDQLNLTDKLGVSIKFAGSAMAINGFMVSMGLQPSYDMSSILPLEKQVEGLWGTFTGSGYGRTDDLFITKPIREIFYGIGELAWGDAEGLEETINDPEIRELIRAALNLALPYGGTQVGRVAETLGNMYQGFIPVPSSSGGYEEVEFGTADNKSIFPQEYVEEDYPQSFMLGPRRATSYLDERYPDTGWYEPKNPSSPENAFSILEGLMVPQRIERQKERVEEDEGLQKLFSFLPGGR